MTTYISDRLKPLGVFYLGRYPFILALLLFMILAERAKEDKNIPPIDQHYIYGFQIVLVLVGLGMSYDLGRKHSALIFAVQLTMLASTIYTNDRFKYSPWLKNRIINRTIGLIGVYVIYAFLTSRDKNKQLQKIGEGLLAIFTATYMFILVNSEEDRKLFNERIPLGDISLFFLITVMGACVMIYVSGGLFLTDASQAIMCINAALLLTIDSAFHFWTKKRGVPYWVQVLICIDDITISIGLYVMAFAKIYWKNRMPTKDEWGRPFKN